MALNAKQYAQIKHNLTMWHKLDREGIDEAVLWDTFVECRNAFQLVIDAAEENRSPSLWERLTGAFRG